MSHVVLASSSPRRRELLAGLGLEVRTRPADIDETVLAGESPLELVARLASGKVAAAAAAAPDSLVIAADTIVVLGSEVLNKPQSEAENRAFVARLAGTTHEVFTGHALRLRGRAEEFVVRTEVTFRSLSDDEVARYAATGEGHDKAGGYAIQGRGAALVERIVGCYSNVVGLSLPAVVGAARRLGVELV